VSPLEPAAEETLRPTYYPSQQGSDGGRLSAKLIQCGHRFVARVNNAVLIPIAARSSSVQRSRRRGVYKMLDGVCVPTPNDCTGVTAGRRKLFGEADVFIAPSQFRFSIRFAARQMSISGIAPVRLAGVRFRNS